MNPNLILIFICLVLGVLLRRTGKFPKNAAHAFNSFVIWVSLPALVLFQIPKLLEKTVWNAELMIPVSMAWISFVLSFLLFSQLGKRLGWGRGETGAIVLTAGFGNTSFVGLPLLNSVLGPESTPIVLLVDQPGSFLALSTLGLIFASTYTPLEEKTVRFTHVLKNVFTFPPFVSLIVSILGWSVGIQLNESLITVLDKLASTLIPLALIAVGFQLKLSLSVLRGQWKPLALGLSFKLVFVPLFFIGLYVFVLGSRTFSTHVTLLESAMAPMITSGVFAEEFGFSSEISGLMIGVGIPVSLITVYLWESVFGNLLI